MEGVEGVEGVEEVGRGWRGWRGWRVEGGGHINLSSVDEQPTKQNPAQPSTTQQF